MNQFLSLRTKIFLTYLKLVAENRFLPASHSGSIHLFEKVFTYGNRGSLHGMFKEIFIQQNYYIEPTDQPLRILDCGCNMGLSLLYFRLLAPRAHIQGFEPNPHTFSLLSKNVTDNDLNVTLHSVGLASLPGTATLYTDSGDLSSQSASLTKHLETKKIELQTIDVKLVRLSEYVQDEVDILKLDIEGSEGEVLEELAHAGKLAKIKTIFMEYHFDGVNTVYPLGKILQLLEQAGFTYVIESGIKFPFKITSQPKNHSYKITAWQK